MDARTYDKIYDMLDSSTLEAISRDFDIKDDVLKCILNQKRVRRNKSLYHKVANNSPALLKRWEGGESILSLSSETGLSCVLMSMILLKRRGISRKKVRRMIKYPEGVEEKWLKNELCEAVKNDPLFSPRAHSLQVKRARACEGGISRWLTERDIEFLTEEEIKKHTNSKTPDFLLKTKLSIENVEIKWIESKGLFGDMPEHRRFLDKQYLEYIKFFGAGMAVYWYGFVDSISKGNQGLLIKDSTYFGVDDVQYIQ